MVATSLGKSGEGIGLVIAFRVTLSCAGGGGSKGDCVGVSDACAGGSEIEGWILMFFPCFVALGKEGFIICEAGGGLPPVGDMDTRLEGGASVIRDTVGTDLESPVGDVSGVFPWDTICAMALVILMEEAVGVEENVGGRTLLGVW